MNKAVIISNPKTEGVSVLDVEELKGIGPSKAEVIKQAFAPMVQMLESFEESYNEVVSEASLGITPQITAKAKRLRLDIGRVRIDTGKLKDQQKEYIKLEDKAIMGVHNILVWAVTEKEDKLKEIEKHYELQEQKRLEKLQADRAELLAPYVEDAFERDLSKFEDDEFEALLSAKKQAQADKVAAELKAEEERIAKEKAEKEAIAKIEIENAILKKEAELRIAEENKKKALVSKRSEELVPYINFIRDYNSVINSEEEDYQKQLVDLEKAKSLQDKHNAEQEQIRIKKEEAAKTATKLEKEKREKLEKELADRKLAEEKLLAEKEASLQAELSKGDAAKFEDLLTDLENLKSKYEFKSEKNKRLYSSTGELLDKIIGYLNEKR